MLADGGPFDEPLVVDDLGPADDGLDVLALPCRHAPGDFPVTDRHAQEIITFPADQHLSVEQLDRVIETVRGYYADR